jgi:multidrug resistance efflux pump
VAQAHDPRGGLQSLARDSTPPPAVPASTRQARPRRIAPILLTLSAVLLAGLCGWWMWNAYEGTPWTRDGTVESYVITEKPEVSGRIVSLPVKADQFVHKGDVLLVIEPTDFSIAVSNAEAALAKAKANVGNSQVEANRRFQLNDLAVSNEERQNYETSAQVAQANYNQALSDLAQARVNLERTTLRSPVNGYITNLRVQVGDYATARQRVLSIVDSDSFWVAGYFLETQLADIHLNDPAKILLLGHHKWLRGHVIGISRGIEVPNAQADSSGLATVNPIFTWIRLAQRVPVRIAIDEVPPSTTLVMGLTATVEIDRTSHEGPPVTNAPGASPTGPPRD